MTFAAEPYGTFVEDLLANLTGGVSRVRHTFLADEPPLQLADHERVRPTTVLAAVPLVTVCVWLATVADVVPLVEELGRYVSHRLTEGAA